MIGLRSRLEGKLDSRASFCHIASPLAAMEQTKNKRWWGLFRRRECTVPTWRGWLVILVVIGLPLFIGGRHLHSFLSLTKPVPGGLLVVEGWASDAVFEQAKDEFRTNHYERLFVTGGPIEKGQPFSEFKTYAEMGAATLLKLGMSSNSVQAVPAPWVRQDRTYAAAVALRNWLRQRGVSPAKVNLITVGPHARRSRLMLQDALGRSVEVGVVAIEPDDYDTKHWWRSSAGVRGVIGEALAYAYARFLFRQPEP